MTDLFHEGVTVRTAFADLVHHVCRPDADVDTVPLDEVLAGLEAFGKHRFAALLFAGQHVDSVEAALVLAQEVERWVQEGRRPRSLPQLLGPQETANVERAFARNMTGAQPWWRRLRERVARAIVADDETSERLARADSEQRVREGKRP
jgi:hypothetical protein